MNQALKISGSGIVVRLAMVSVATIMLAGCSDSTRLGDPFADPFRASPSIDRSPTASVHQPKVAAQTAPQGFGDAWNNNPTPRSAPIVSEPLAPIGASASNAAYRAAAPVAAAAAAPVAAAPAMARAGSALGNWSPEGGTPIVVSQGESADMIAQRYGVPTTALLAANGFASKAQVTPGARMVIPTYRAGAAAAAAAAQPSRAVNAVQTAAQPTAFSAPQRAISAPVVAQTRTVAAAAPAMVRGAQPSNLAAQLPSARAAMTAPVSAQADKAAKLAEAKAAKAQADAQAKLQAQAAAAQKAELKKAQMAEAAAKKAHLDAPKLAAANAATAAAATKLKTAEIKAAEFKPAKAEKAKVEQAKVALVAPTPAPEQPKPAKTEKAQVAAVAPAATVDAATTTAALTPANAKADAPSDSANPEFRWPARGRVIQSFGNSGNDGINIAVPEGTQVKAAETGVVAYAGSELKGYGNLVLIRHPNGFVSAYANNGSLNVKRGDQVKRGQTIALSGQSGNVASPQLHFELRKGSKPVDPTGYLAGL